MLSGSIITLTGLHIGGNTVGIEIGGKDNPIIRNPATNEPFIPGSSLKGKMRSLLEFNLEKHIDPSPKDNKVWGDVHTCNEIDCPICNIFGSSADGAQNGPTRLIVRDAHLDEEFKTERKEKNPNWTPLDLTEDKFENTINRITARATPRNFERVLPGVRFKFEMIYRIFERFTNGNGDGGEKDKEFFSHVIDGLRLIENDTLGGAGSRGCGQIKFLFNINGEKDKELSKIYAKDFKTITPSE